jgi:hypothetical protein
MSLYKCVGTLYAKARKILREREHRELRDEDDKARKRGKFLSA